MEEEKKESKGGNTRIPFGLCAKYGISLPEGATPKDAWAALGKKGISPEEGYASLNDSKTYKQGTSYEDIMKGNKSDASSKSSDVFDIAKKNFVFLEDKNSFDKTGNDNINAGVWEIKNAIKAAYEAANKGSTLTDSEIYNIAKDHSEFIKNRGSLNPMNRDSLDFGDMDISEVESMMNAAYNYKKGNAVNGSATNNNDINSQMEDLSKKMLGVAAEYSKYKAGTPEYDKVDKEYNDLASQYEKLQKSKYSKLRSDEPFKNKVKSNKSTAKTGPKVHEEFIDYLKHDIGVDLSNARDTQFDNRKMFNIDTREITPDKLRDLKNYATRTQSGFSGYDVKVMDNGAYRLGIQVTKR